MGLLDAPVVPRKDLDKVIADLIATPDSLLRAAIEARRNA